MSLYRQVITKKDLAKQNRDAIWKTATRNIERYGGDPLDIQEFLLACNLFLGSPYVTSFSLHVFTKLRFV